MKLQLKVLLISLLPFVLSMIGIAIFSVEKSSKTIAGINEEYINTVGFLTNSLVHQYFKTSLDSIKEASDMNIILDYIKKWSTGEVTQQDTDYMNSFINDFSRVILNSIVINIIDKNGYTIASSIPSLVGTSYKDKDYFIEIRKSSSPYYIKLKEDQILGKEFKGIAIRITHKIISPKTKEVIGYMTVPIDFGKFSQDYLVPIKPFKTGYVFVGQKDGDPVYHPNPDVMKGGGPVIKEMIESKMWQTEESGSLFYSYNNVVSYANITTESITKLKIGIKSAQKDAFKDIYQLRFEISFVIVVNIYINLDLKSVLLL